MVKSRKVFLCSTAYDLEMERNAVEAALSNTPSKVPLTCIRSESADFLSDPNAIGQLHSYELCLEQIEKSDYVVLLIKQRYNRPLIEIGGKHVSITHAEYLRAYELRKPIFCFIDQRTWSARNALKTGATQDFVKAGHLGVFDLIEDYVSKPRNNWAFFFDSPAYISSTITKTILEFDDSILIDETIADGSFVYVDQVFEKTWTLRNMGMVTWKERYLEQVGHSPLIPHVKRIQIPETAPGEDVIVAVKFTSPRYPALCASTWKMHESDGTFSFPNKRGIFCEINAVYKKP